MGSVYSLLETLPPVCILPDEEDPVDENCSWPASLGDELPWRKDKKG